MFFYLSKLIWFFLQPSSLLLFLLAASLVLQRSQYAWLGKRLSSLAIIALLVAAFSPLAHILTVPLENRFSRPDLTLPQNKPDGIIILGGMINSIVTNKRNIVTMNQASERLTEAVALAKKYPEAKILFSGGSTRLLYDTQNEAEIVQDFFNDMGVDPKRIILERQARNTWENAVFSKKIARPTKQENWLMITSAFHMPRSMGCFRKAGFTVLPWPVDYRSRGWSDIYRIFAIPSQGLRRLDLVTKEWIGLAAYWLTGKTSSFFPQQIIGDNN